MAIVTLERVPAQALSVTIGGRRFDVRVYSLGHGMAADVTINGQPVVTGQRLLAGVPFLPYRYLEAGNLLLVTPDGEAPDWTRFGVTQTLVTLDDAGDPVSAVVPGGSGGGGGPNPPTPTAFLERAKNLSDLTDVAAALINLGVYSAGAIDILLSALQAELIALQQEVADLPAPPDLATAADLRAMANDDRYLTPRTVSAAADFVTLTDAPFIDIDMSAGTNFQVTLGGNRVLNGPLAGYAWPGTTGTILIKQPATGGPYTLAYASSWLPFGSTPALSTAANAVDLLTWIVETSGKVRFTLAKGGAA